MRNSGWLRIRWLLYLHNLVLHLRIVILHLRIVVLYLRIVILYLCIVVLHLHIVVLRSHIVVLHLHIVVLHLHIVVLHLRIVILYLHIVVLYSTNYKPYEILHSWILKIQHEISDLNLAEMLLLKMRRNNILRYRDETVMWRMRDNWNNELSSFHSAYSE